MQYDEAISHLDLALAQDPAVPELRTLKAYALCPLNRLDGTLETLRKELEARPRRLQALILLSFIQHKRGHPDEAGMAHRCSPRSWNKRTRLEPGERSNPEALF